MQARYPDGVAWVHCGQGGTPDIVLRQLLELVRSTQDAGGRGSGAGGAGTNGGTGGTASSANSTATGGVEAAPFFVNIAQCASRPWVLPDSRECACLSRFGC